MFNISTNKPQTQLADKKPAVKALRQATLRMKKTVIHRDDNGDARVRDDDRGSGCVHRRRHFRR